jgi:hypothetical protein
VIKDEDDNFTYLTVYFIPDLWRFPSKFFNGVEFGPVGGVGFSPLDGVWPIHRSTSHCGTP